MMFTSGAYFYICQNMKQKDAIESLAALAQESRLAIFRMLEDPRINFAIAQRGQASGVNHLGFQRAAYWFTASTSRGPGTARREPDIGGAP
jgi:hypothetical protein